MPKVSVIVPNYNHAPYLEQRIESILNQSYQDFELILLDDCSTDNSIEVLSKYATHPKVSHYIVNEQNSGSTFKQWDKGINLAAGEWIWIAESDDWAEPDFLEKLVNEIKKDDDTVLAYSSIRFVSENGLTMFENKYSESIKRYNSKDFINEKLIVDCLINNVSAVIFRRSACSFDLEKISKYKLCGDWMFYVLLCQKGHVIHIDSCLSNFRRHSESTAYKLERKGLGIIEGIDIYRAIKKNKLLKKSTIHYNISLAKKWLSNEIYYNYSSNINRTIRLKLFPKNLLLILLHAFGKVRKISRGVKYKTY